MQKKDLKHFINQPNTQLGLFNNGLTENQDSQLIICSGVNNSYKDGIIIKDLGYEKIGTTLEAGKIVTGLHHFVQSSASNKVLATINNTAGTNLTLQYNNAGTWTAINVGATYDTFEDAKTEMEDFIGYCFIVGYDSTDSVFLPVASLTGTTFSTTTNVTSMPQAKYVKRYRDRLYIANCYYSAVAYPYRVYFSSVPTAGAITWTPATDYIDVDFSEEITGIYSVWDKLIIFTASKAYYYDQSVKKDFLAKGCVNGRTIQAYNRYLIWADKDNVYITTSIGDIPNAVGNAIQQLIRNATPSVFNSCLIDDEYSIYLGDTSANGINYSKCVATFNFRTLSWRWRSFYDTVSVMAKYSYLGKDYILFGTTGGMVMRKGKFTDSTLLYSDATAPIVSEWQTLANDLGNPTSKKTVYRISTYSEVPNGMHIRMRMIKNNNEKENTFIDLGEVTQIVQDFDLANVMADKLEGNFIQFDGSEMSTKPGFSMNGISVLYEETAPNN